MERLSWRIASLTQSIRELYPRLVAMSRKRAASIAALNASGLIRRAISSIACPADDFSHRRSGLDDGGAALSGVSRRRAGSRHVARFVHAPEPRGFASPQRGDLVDEGGISREIVLAGQECGADGEARQVQPLFGGRQLGCDLLFLCRPNPVG
ncbi:MAG: hypothetical protein JNG85_12885 [Spirochaetaceae bacterium]|nr:hypothetical protein [Spirochaetaceae bacterium]